MPTNPKTTEKVVRETRNFEQKCAELGIDLRKSNLRGDDRELLIQNLEKLTMLEDAMNKRNQELKQIKKSLGNTNLKITSSPEVKLTVDELNAIGITLDSRILQYDKLSPAVREQIDVKIGEMMLGKISNILDTCFTPEKLEANKNIKDAALAFSMLYDKLRLQEGKSTQNKSVKHDLSSLVNKNNQLLTDLDLKCIDAELKDEENED